MYTFSFKYNPDEMVRYQVHLDGSGDFSPLSLNKFIQHVRDTVWSQGGTVENAKSTVFVTLSSHNKDRFDEYVKNGFTVYDKTFQVIPLKPWDSRITKLPRLAWRLYMSAEKIRTAQRVFAEIPPPSKLIRCPTHVRIDDYSPQAPFSPRMSPETNFSLPEPIGL